MPRPDIDDLHKCWDKLSPGNEPEADLNLARHDILTLLDYIAELEAFIERSEARYCAESIKRAYPPKPFPSFTIEDARECRPPTPPFHCLGYHDGESLPRYCTTMDLSKVVEDDPE
jgi:hypothetical protein